MEKNVLKAVKRDVKTNLNSLRTQGLVPAVLYGHGFTPITVAIEEKPFGKLLQATGGNALISLDIDGKSESALIKAVQRDMIKRNPIHIDFQRVIMTEKVEVSVAIHVVGEAPGVKVSGGTLEHVTRALKVRCLPSNIPHAVEVNVGALQLGDTVLVKDLQLGEGVEIMTDPGLIVINIVIPKVEEETPAPGAAVPGAAEPEVIAKGKKPEEGAEGDAAKAAPAAGGAKAAPAAGGAKAPAGDAKKPDAKK